MHWSANVPDFLASFKRFLKRRGRSAEDAEDLIQEAFLRLERYCQRGNEVECAEAFLRSTITHLAVSEFRAEQPYLSGRTEFDVLELKLRIEGIAKSPVGIKVFASSDGREETVITYDPSKKQLIVDFEKSSIRAPVKVASSILFAVSPEVMKRESKAAQQWKLPDYPQMVSQQIAPFTLQSGEPLELDIFLDKSVLEVFVNGRLCVTQVVYPELEISNRLKIFSGAETVRVRNIQAWSMADTNAF